MGLEIESNGSISPGGSTPPSSEINMGYTGKQKNQYQNNWKKKRRAKYLQGKSCVHCGSTDRLQFDHIDPKRKNDHRIWSWSIPRLEEELKKCQILCTKCHCKKTGLSNRRSMKHGTLLTYKVWRCRCDLCRKSNAVYEVARRGKPSST